MWVGWARAVLECDFSQLVGGMASQSVVPLNGSAAGWIGAALALRGQANATGQRLGQVLAVLVEVERQLVWALSEMREGAA